MMSSMSATSAVSAITSLRSMAPSPVAVGVDVPVPVFSCGLFSPSGSSAPALLVQSPPPCPSPSPSPPPHLLSLALYPTLSATPSFSAATMSDVVHVERTTSNTSICSYDSGVCDDDADPFGVDHDESPAAATRTHSSSSSEAASLHRSHSSLSFTAGSASHSATRMSPRVRTSSCSSSSSSTTSSSSTAAASRRPPVASRGASFLSVSSGSSVLLPEVLRRFKLKLLRGQSVVSMNEDGEEVEAVAAADDDSLPPMSRPSPSGHRGDSYSTLKRLRSDHEHHIASKRARFVPMVPSLSSLPDHLSCDKEFAATVIARELVDWASQFILEGSDDDDSECEDDDEEDDAESIASSESHSVDASPRSSPRSASSADDDEHDELSDSSSDHSSSSDDSSDGESSDDDSSDDEDDDDGPGSLSPISIPSHSAETCADSVNSFSPHLPPVPSDRPRPVIVLPTAISAAAPLMIHRPASSPIFSSSSPFPSFYSFSPTLSPCKSLPQFPLDSPSHSLSH